MSHNATGSLNARLSDSLKSSNVGDAASGNVSRSNIFTAYKCDSGGASLGVNYKINVEHNHNIDFTSGSNGGDEARPINYTIRIWKRTA